jgi:hypothetical protein
MAELLAINKDLSNLIISEQFKTWREKKSFNMHLIQNQFFTIKLGVGGYLFYIPQKKYIKCIYVTYTINIKFMFIFEFT